MPRETSPWYQEGIRFACRRCGRCCAGEPGVVWVNAREVHAMSLHLGISTDDFRVRFLRRVSFRISLRERPNGDCVLLDNGCSVYPVRPRQCRSFPFWKEALHSPESFKQAIRSCPGVGSGKLYSPAEIDRISEEGFPAESSDVHP